MQGFVAFWLVLHKWIVQKIIHSDSSKVLIRLLVDLRKKAGLTQAEFADKLGWLRQTVSAIERGERMLLVLELIEYLKPLNVPAVEFIARLEAELAVKDNRVNSSTQI